MVSHWDLKTYTCSQHTFSFPLPSDHPSLSALLAPPALSLGSYSPLTRKTIYASLTTIHDHMTPFWAHALLHQRARNT